MQFFCTLEMEREPLPYRKPSLKLVEQARGLKQSLHTSVWRMPSVPNSWHSWQGKYLQKKQEGHRPVKLVGWPPQLVGRPEKVVYRNKKLVGRGERGSAGRGEGGGKLPTTLGGPQTTNPSWLTTKSGLQGEKLVYIPVPPSRQRIRRFGSKQTKKEEKQESARWGT